MPESSTEQSLSLLRASLAEAQATVRAVGWRCIAAPGERG